MSTQITAQQTVIQYELVDFKYEHKKGEPARATVWLTADLHYKDKAEGVGAVSAIFHAIDKIVYVVNVRLLSYHIHNDQQSIDSVAEVYVMLEKDKNGHEGWGRARDVVEASALAYIEALNSILANKPTCRLRN